MEANSRPTILKAHIALNVSDVGQSVEFYKRMLGMEPTKLRPGYAKFDVQNPPLNLTLNTASQSARGSVSHLGLQVASTDDVFALRREWLSLGLPVRDEMKTECCYALQDKAWVRDPDGNEWEVFTVIADVEQKESTCCIREALSLWERVPRSGG